MSAAVVTKGICERYSVLNGHEHATVVLRCWDNPPPAGSSRGMYYCGEIMIHSTFGSWANTWTACGVPFKRFLIGAEFGYVFTKFMGADLERFDGEATLKQIKSDIIRQRRGAAGPAVHPGHLPGRDRRVLGAALLLRGPSAGRPAVCRAGERGRRARGLCGEEAAGMSETTGISWTDATFNSWWGCQKVSPACDHCYAERDAHRFAPGKVLWGVGSERRTFGEKHWNEPLRWAKTMPAKLGRRPRVFCASMGDWLDLDAPLGEFVRLLDTIRLTPELDWLLLTKRIGNVRSIVNAALVAGSTGNDPLRAWIVDWWSNGRPPANVWLGATVVNQKEADRDIPKLLAVPARVRFLSIEPMLGPIELQKACTACCPNRDCFAHSTGRRVVVDSENGGTLAECICSRLNGLHWVIAGGESGPHARPAHPDWFRSLKLQCQSAGVPFFMKQMTKKAEIPADLLVREFPHAA